MEFLGLDPQVTDDERKLAAIHDLAFDAVFELNSEGRITGWSPSAERLFGWTPSDAIGQHVESIVSPKHRVAFLSSLFQTITSGLAPEKPLPMRSVHRDGRRFSTELFLYIRQSGSVSVFVRNLMDREQFENLLSERANQRAILNFLEDGYAELDLAGNYQWVNDAYCRIFGRLREEVLDTRYQRISHHPVSADLREIFKTVYKTGEPVRSFEFEYLPGQFCESTFSLKRGENGQPTGFVTLTRNITERKRHERELADAKDAAESANRAKSEFLANMSHEIRTPMNGIIGMTELALSTDLAAEPREYLGMVRSSAEDLLVIINDILDYSKIEAGKIDLDRVQFNLIELVGDTLKCLAMPAHRKSLELSFHADANVPEVAIGDPVRLRQVLMNLAGNAVKFTAKGEVVVDVNLESQEEAYSTVHFTVRDTGIGVPLEAQKRLFRAFEQADCSTTREYGGTGLGLAISKKIVDLMSGEIWMESTEAGSAFHFTAKLEVAQSREEPFIPYSDLSGISVLIIDDNETNRRILEKTVERWGMDPHTADSGAAGLAKIEDSAALGRPFQLVLLDEEMPEMGGLEMIERVRGMPHLRGVTILMLTSSDQTSSAARCRELGVETYLVKPVKPAELLSMIQKALGAALPERKATPKGIPATDCSLSILVAEDNAVNQRLVMAILQKMGHRPVLAVNGFEAIAKASEAAFDLIMMDVQMPGMDGFEATRRLRSQQQVTGWRTSIIAMTAYAMSGDRERCLDAGMDDYVSKPVTLESIARVLARYSESAPL
ncbi:MAG: response regulator [Bryobacteraceae bacterium]